MKSDTADLAPGAATWRTWRNMHVVSDSAHSLCYVKHDVVHILEVRNISHCHQRRTEPRQQVTRIENWMTFGYIVFEIWERTSKHIYRHVEDEVIVPCQPVAEVVSNKMTEIKLSLLPAFYAEAINIQQCRFFIVVHVNSSQIIFRILLA